MSAQSQLSQSIKKIARADAHVVDEPGGAERRHQKTASGMGQDQWPDISVPGEDLRQEKSAQGGHDGENRIRQMGGPKQQGGE